jgi:hypothetical protein
MVAVRLGKQRLLVVLVVLAWVRAHCVQMMMTRVPLEQRR